MANSKSEIPDTMRALRTGSRSWLTIFWRGITRGDVSHGSSVEEEVPTPKPEPNEILVKVKTVALNPTDWKHIAFLSPPNSIIGCDYAGTVAAIGSSVPADAWKIGQRVVGTAHGGLYKDQGAFATYLRIPHDLAWTPPLSLSDAEGTTYGVSALTSMMALYHKLSLPWPDETAKGVKPTQKTILIYAGSTTSGLMALQMAKHAGLRVATTCSPRNFDLVKQYGADDAFDYNSTTLVQDIVSKYPDLEIAMDCFSEGKSTSICQKVIASNPQNGKGGRIITLLGGTSPKTKNGITVIPILAYTLLGRPFQWFAPLGPKWPAVPEDREAAVRFVKQVDDVLEWLRPLPTELVPGGWDGLREGMKMLREGKVSGRKLVVELA